MKATIFSDADKNRVPLHKVVPLDTPFMVSIEACSSCNLKCAYCFQSLNKDGLSEKGYDFSHMDMDVFSEIVKQLEKFPQRVKTVLFSGNGEPTLHQNLPLMIEILHKADVAEKIEMHTNGLLLSPKLSDALINAGLTGIKISVNGLSGDDYLEHCGVKINFEDFLRELGYFYGNRQTCDMRIKILDVVLKNRDEEYFKVFGDICDKIMIEHAIKRQPLALYGNDIGFHSDLEYGPIYFDETKEVKICNKPFRTMTVWANGKGDICGNAVNPCAVFFDAPELFQVWNSKAHRNLMLYGLKTELDAKSCKACQCLQAFAFDENNLDHHADEIAERVIML